MRATRRFALLSLSIAAVVVSGAACGAFSGKTEDTSSDDGGGKDDATIAADASPMVADGSSTDAGVAFKDATQPTTFCITLDASVYGCADCAGYPLRCFGPGTDVCLGSCSTCTQKPAECFLCDSIGKNPVGTCQPDNDAAYCLNGNYGGGSACSCATGDASACPGENQECIANDAGARECHSCGEPLTLVKAPKCKNGKTCDLGAGPGALTCH